MPEMYFVVRWPDDATLTYYSPSLVVREYLEPGAAYALPEFIERSRTALHIASERVRSKYGFACPRAALTLEHIEAKALEFPDAASATVRVEAHSAAIRSASESGRQTESSLNDAVGKQNRAEIPSSANSTVQQITK